jgi:uncharacterized protein
MKRRGLWITLVAALALAAPAWAQPPVWTVRDADSELVLFGSVHVLPPGLDWRPDALDAALKTADDIWFELPVDAETEAETARLAAARGLLQPGGSLSALLAPDDVARMGRVVAAYGASPVMMDHLQPWLAEVVLAGLAFRKSGAEGQFGVERMVSASAPPQTPRRAFETPAEQIGYFADAPQADQIASLAQTLKDMEADPAGFADLVAAWLAGDLGAIDREALGPLRAASPVLFRRMVTDRNARWTEVLRQRLAGQGRTVVVVGVGHLIGAGSVPERLRALGYSVTGP